MRVIGMLGGMSWESSSLYYRIVNEEARRRLGDTSSARSILWTVEVELIDPADEDERLYPSARLHAVAAVEAALREPQERTR